MSTFEAVKAGQLDPGFAENGRLTLPAVFTGPVNSSVVAPDGSLIVAGLSAVGDRQSVYVIAKFSAEGVQDLSFGTAGFVSGSFVPGSAAVGYVTLFAQTQGLLVTGKDLFEDAVVLGAARLSWQGQPDESFGQHGALYYRLEDVVGGASPSALHFRVMSAVTDAGKILLATGLSYPDGEFHPMVVRLHTDGSLDNSWGGKGFKVVVLEAQTGFRSSRLYGIHADGDKVVVSANYGGSPTETGNQNFIARFQADGALDLTFAIDGVLLYPAVQAPGQPVVDDRFNLLRMVSSGFSPKVPHYLGTGMIFQPSPRKSAGLIVGFKGDGKPDTQFNDGRPVLVDPEPEGAYIDQCIAQPGSEGVIIASGSRDNGTLICRYSAEGVLDRDFGEAGYVIKPFTGGLHTGIFSSHPVVVNGNRLLIDFLNEQDRPVIDGYRL